MSWLDPRQWLIVAAFIAASMLGYHFWSARLVGQGDAAGYGRARAEYNAAAIKATAAEDQRRETNREAARNAEKAAQGRIEKITQSTARAKKELPHASLEYPVCRIDPVTVRVLNDYASAPDPAKD